MSALDALAHSLSQNSHNSSEFRSDRDDEDDADTASQRSISLSSPPDSPHSFPHNFLEKLVVPSHDEDDDDDDNASQRSISLSSPAYSPRQSGAFHAVPLSSQLANLTPTSSQRNDSANKRSLPFSSSANSMHKFSAIPMSQSGSKSPPRHATPITSRESKRESHPYTLDTDISSEADNFSMYTHDGKTRESSMTSAAQSLYEESVPATYPPTRSKDSIADAESIMSFASSQKKARPESLLVNAPGGSLVLGIALVDFNHMEGPKIEFSQGAIFDDEEVAKILPFLALPDGAHLNSEDYSYFHLVPSSPNPTTIFGISCNMQMAASDLIVKDVDVTRSIVQKAVVVLASKPVFGPIRDKLRVVTHALFNQRDFRETDILMDFIGSLEGSLRTQLTESGLYMGTSLRSLVHTFRQRTLVLLKALLLQKKVMFYGHPVERLCTFQYSLISLVPGLLQTLDDCGSPPLAARAPTLSRPTSLRTSDHKSMMAYIGLPLDVFGKDAFFQPYLPLQQLDMLQETRSWLCGTTNSIVTQQKEIDLLVNTETGVFEFRTPQLERAAGLTAADRKWMDDIVRDVNDGWNDDDPTRPPNMQFKGSDDYLRSRFEEYISAALSSVRYRDFVAKGEGNGVLITGGSGGDANSTEDFNPLWISEFKKTNAYEVWERTTDPMLFDVVEPRHPCNEKVSVVTDITLRLQEGIQELKLEQQLAPTREAISRTISAGSTNFFKAVEGVRGRWTTQRSPPSSSSASEVDVSLSSTPVEITKFDADIHEKPLPSPAKIDTPPALPKKTVGVGESIRPLSVTVGSWGAGLGSFLSAKASRFSMVRPPWPASSPFAEGDSPSTPPPPNEKSPPPPPPRSLTPTSLPFTPRSRTQSLAPLTEADADLGIEELQPRDLDSTEAKEDGEATGMAL